MVISVVPVPVTNEPVTSMVSTVESSDDFLMTIFPLSASTASEKVKTILSSTPTLVAPSEGEEEDRVGAVLINSKPVDKVYSLASSPIWPTINILVPSGLKAIPLGLVSSPDIENESSNEAVETSKPVVNVYWLTSLPRSPGINILVPSVLKAIDLGISSWAITEIF